MHCVCVYAISCSLAICLLIVSQLQRLRIISEYFLQSTLVASTTYFPRFNLLCSLRIVSKKNKNFCLDCIGVSNGIWILWFNLHKQKNRNETSFIFDAADNAKEMAAYDWYEPKQSEVIKMPTTEHLISTTVYSMGKGMDTEWFL